MDLVDTNIFLEILFQQTKAAACENYLRNNAGKFFISSFTLHTIGVLLFKKHQPLAFEQFIKDFPPDTTVLPLSANGYSILPTVKTNFNLDFDDSFQFVVAQENDLRLVTQDPDFKKVGSAIQVLYI